MSAAVWKQTRSPAEIRAIVQYMVRNFDRDPVRSREILRNVAMGEPGELLEAAVPLLTNPDDSRGAHYLVTLIVSHDLLLKALISPELTQEQALALARSAARIDSLADVTLARQLADSASAEAAPLRPEQAGRLMEILAQISDGTRVLPSLMRMLRHPNPYLRSKAVKLIGQGSRSIKWVRNRLAEADPRIRANAIEAIWGVDTEESRALLAAAVRDSNNRVAGNALVALHRIGDCAAIPELLKMASHEAALFRSTAAWAMGQTGDPRFAPALARLMCDESTAVRSRALSALARVKSAAAQSRQGAHWRVSALLLENDPAKGRRLQATVSGSPGADPPALLPTSFIVSEDGHPLPVFKVVERPPVEAFSVVFLFPRSAEAGSPWVEAALEARTWKRPSDLWAMMPYLPEGDGEGMPLAEEPPKFSSSVQNLDVLLRQPVSRAVCADIWMSIWRAIKPDPGPGRGRRHLIVFSPGETRGVAGHERIAMAAASRASIQVVSQAADPHMEEFCRRVRAHFTIAADDADASGRLGSAYLNLLARYEIAWPATAGAREWKLRVHSSAGWGELTAPLPG